MYGHSRVDFPDLRVIDAEGTQVPWRPEPTATPVPSQPVALVARGSRDGTVTVVVDRGAVRPVIDRIELEIPDRVFVGRVEVQGSTTGAEGTYGALSTTQIYSVRGAVAARSTTAVFPPTDYRFLLVRARGVSDITGASVARDPSRPPLQHVDARSTRRDESRSTVVSLDSDTGACPSTACASTRAHPRSSARSRSRARTTTIVRSPDVERDRPISRCEPFDDHHSPHVTATCA